MTAVVRGAMLFGNVASRSAGKLRVSHLITQLGEQAARQTELDVFNNDSVGSAIPAGVGGGAANASRDRAYRAGLAHQERRLSFARNDARLAFEKQHPQTLATLDRTVEVAGTDLWDVFKTRQPWVNAVVGLYDVDEVESYLDFRCMIGHIVPGLLHCAAGADYLATYVDGNAPRGLLKYAVMGHPDIAKYVGKAAGHVRKLAVDPMLKALQDLLAKFPPDGASQQLSVLMGALVAKGKLKSPQSYWTSAYRPIMEVLDGDMARLHEVPKEELGAWMRERMGGHGVNGFRPRTVERAAGALVEVYDSEEVQAQLDQSTKLSTRLRFWHNAKLGLGGLGLFASAYSANAA